MAQQPFSGVDLKTTHAERLERLASIQATDAGIFVLAVHSFTEGIIRERIRIEEGDDDRYSTLIGRYKENCKRKLGGPHPSLEVLDLLKNCHGCTNDVRHRFAAIEVKHARVATQHLRRFCLVSGIDCPEQLGRLEKYLSAWDERKSVGALVDELETIRKALGVLGAKGGHIVDRIAELDKAEREAEHYRAEIQIRDRQIEELSRITAGKDEKVDALRKERAELEESLRAAARREAAEVEARAYRESFRSAITYSRTRADYERTIVRLTVEQKDVLRQIRLDSDFYVKGAAGTGKTLVLLEAIRKAKGKGEQSELGLEELSGSIALLTYTRTLSEYDRYLAHLLELGEGDRIQTASSFILDRLHRLVPEAKIEWKLSEDRIMQYCPAWLSPREFAAEADSFIWANLITREEYLDERFPRRGMKRPLHANQREEVWLAVEALESDMKRTNVWNQNLAAREIVRLVRDGARIPQVDYLFIDETQDLSAAMLAALKLSARKSLVLAGDGDQSIYQPFVSFERAGIDIVGRTRILRTNFRNTVQLHEFAERYRALGQDIDAETRPAAFRDGPEPELVAAETPDELSSLLVRYVDLYTRCYGYDLENIAILAPAGNDLKSLASLLESSGIPSATLNTDGFSFAETGKVRLSTMHSAKGLDFPVVFLFIPKLHFGDGKYEEKVEDRMNRNLIYVAITRAMDQLVMFVKEGLTTKAVADLSKAKSRSSSVVDRNTNEEAGKPHC